MPRTYCHPEAIRAARRLLELAPHVRAYSSPVAVWIVAPAIPALPKPAQWSPKRGEWYVDIARAGLLAPAAAPVQVEAQEPVPAVVAPPKPKRACKPRAAKPAAAAPAPAVAEKPKRAAKAKPWSPSNPRPGWSEGQEAWAAACAAAKCAESLDVEALGRSAMRRCDTAEGPVRASGTFRYVFDPMPSVDESAHVAVQDAQRLAQLEAAEKHAAVSAILAKMGAEHIEYRQQPATAPAVALAA